MEETKVPKTIKTLYLVWIVFLLIAQLSSCSTTKSCPAYAYNTNQLTK